MNKFRLKCNESRSSSTRVGCTHTTSFHQRINQKIEKKDSSMIHTEASISSYSYMEQAERLSKTYTNFISCKSQSSKPLSFFSPQNTKGQLAQLIKSMRALKDIFSNDPTSKNKFHYHHPPLKQRPANCSKYAQGVRANLVGGKERSALLKIWSVVLYKTKSQNRIQIQKYHPKSMRRQSPTPRLGPNQNNISFLPTPWEKLFLDEDT